MRSWCSAKPSGRPREAARQSGSLRQYVSEFLDTDPPLCQPARAVHASGVSRR